MANLYRKPLVVSQRAPDTGTAHLAAAMAGDSGAFEQMAEPYRRELLTHCYRILGSLLDAEDMVQETFLRAWQRLGTYEGRAPFRAWLYKIATNACLDALDRRPRRTLPPARYPAAEPGAPIPAPVTEPIWLEPFPDDLLAPVDSSPDALFEAHESISLVFLLALQALPPRQRCVLILNDVLDWHANEVAEMLEVTLSTVNSLLHRARATLRKSYPPAGGESLQLKPAEEKTAALLARYVHAWESADVAEIVALVKEDATFAMPPVPLWLQGRSHIQCFISATILAGDARGRWRLLPIQVNGQPGAAWYQQAEKQSGYQAYAVQVLALEGESISGITTFVNPALVRLFGLPAELPA